MITDNYLLRSDLDNFVLVYTMGKVGSTAIARSLEGVGIFCRHLQWLTPETQTFIDKLWEPMADDFGVLQNRLNVSRCRHALREAEYTSLIKVITAIRSPIEQILSQYFYGFALVESYLGKRGHAVTANAVSADILRSVDAYMDNRGLGVADLTQRLCSSNMDRMYFHWIVLNHLNWIDNEFRPTFPAEIRDGFADKGYVIAGNALMLKFEELPTKGEQAVAAYVQRPQFKLARDNVGADRPAGEIYRQVSSTIRFPREFVAHLCDAKYVRHFYTPEERAQMQARWAA